MAGETYQQKDIIELLTNKFVVVIGDSVQRSVYKDLVVFLQEDRYMSLKELKDRGERSFLDDALYEGGRLHNGTHYREVRQFKHRNGQHIVRYYFITKVYNQYWETIFEDLRRGPKPDVIIMNSCLWDMNRYGSSWLYRYQEDMDHMMGRLKRTIPDSCLVMWNTCMPVGSKARGGFMSRRCGSWRQELIRYDVLEANHSAKQAAENHGYDCLDLNYHFRQVRSYQSYRQKDEVHWDKKAHRMITNLILGHIADAWGVAKPKFMKPLDKMGAPKPRARHTRSHTIDARYVDNNPGNTRDSNRHYVIPARRVVITDENNNVEVSKERDFGRKRKRETPPLLSERFGPREEDEMTRKRRGGVAYDRVDADVDRHHSRSGSRSRSRTSSLPKAREALLEPPHPGAIGGCPGFTIGRHGSFEMVNHGQRLSGFNIQHPANRMMLAMPLAQQMMGNAQSCIYQNGQGFMSFGNPPNQLSNMVQQVALQGVNVGYLNGAHF